MQPKLTVSGYRGIWGEGLTKEIAIKYARAFGMFVKENTIHPALRAPLKRGINTQQNLTENKPTILIGRDGRESGQAICEAIIPELEKMGINVIDGNILPTPTVIFAVRKYKYDGAIIVTASHNPIEYNGLKFVNKDAFFINENEVGKVIKYYKECERKYIVSGSLAQTVETSRAKIQQDFMRADRNNISSETIFIKEHADFIIENINVDAIRERKFKVAVDMINASACVLDPYLFEKLGIELISINNIPNGKFAHKPEPLKENLGDIEKFVKENGADLGFAHDPDADRLVVINEKGIMISEEYTVALAVEAVLSKGNHKGKNIVINLSTSQMNADIAEKYGAKCIRTKVGEANVVEEMQKSNAIIGGEGGGGAIYPAINFARDSFTTLALILELLAVRNQNISEVVDTLPKYFMKKDKQNIAGKNLEEMYGKLKTHFGNTKINTLDGIRLDFPDQSWVHLRPSNTEPIIRLFGEAKTEQRINELFAEAKKVIS